MSYDNIPGPDLRRGQTGNVYTDRHLKTNVDSMNRVYVVGLIGTDLE